MNKKVSKVVLLALVLTILMSSISFASAKPIDVYYYGEKVELPTEPIIQNGRTLVPLRSLLELMYFDIDWDGSTRTVAIYKDSLEIELVIGSPYAKITDYDWNILDEITEITKLDAPPVIINGHTLVPLRLIGETMGKLVEWDGVNRRVDISSYPNDHLPFPDEY